MAKKVTEYIGLPPDTIIEVIAIKKDEIHLAEMTIEQFQNIKKKPEFQYKAYQKGFSQFPINKK